MKQVTGNKELGALLRKSRIRSKKSLRSVARKVGISAAHLSRVERGERGADRPVLVSLAAEVLPSNAPDLYRQALELYETMKGEPFDPEASVLRVRAIGSDFLTERPKDRMVQAVGRLFTETAAIAREALRNNDAQQVEHILKVLEVLREPERESREWKSRGRIR